VPANRGIVPAVANGDHRLGARAAIRRGVWFGLARLNRAAGLLALVVRIRGRYHQARSQLLAANDLWAVRLANRIASEHHWLP